MQLLYCIQRLESNAFLNLGRFVNTMKLGTLALTLLSLLFVLPLWTPQGREPEWSGQIAR